MRLTRVAASGVALFGAATAQEVTKYYDPTTNITFSSITHANGVSYRIALPIDSPVADAIFQIVSPNDFAWCGLAWGGHMTQNPLSVSWPTGQTTGQQAIVSSRFAYGYYAIPQPYDSATYTYLRGTSANATHWQVTARCQGCTRWSSSDGDFNIEVLSETVLAYACSSVAPEAPASNTSAFNVHEQFGIWGHDLQAGKSARADFDEWVRGNAGAEV
ncbi:hypothetical protein BDV95DRAFT_655571 [Massariosphaeria phaeospora]|uniref:Cellobiose dehydrogenase-like cytochrome domain-containing protein n=1 Tax=Massariosphaeria phaeospora TaxID=100035 RepID=A0A7C8HY79_9PLEO|nr:hypothetical protein BDV95DRAFT_655571 [Massariosphaeria phaeospora]